MISDLVRFLGLYCIIFWIFLSAFVQLFAMHDNFSGLWSGAIALFEISLGEFDIGPYKQTDWYIHEEVGVIAMVLFIGVSVVVLLNFVIAILSNTYEQISQKSDAVYLKQLIVIKQQIEHEDTLSAMVSSFPPFNLLTIPLIPFLKSWQCPVVNEKVLKIQHLVIAFLSSILWWVIEIPCVLYTWMLMTTF